MSALELTTRAEKVPEAMGYDMTPQLMGTGSLLADGSPNPVASFTMWGCMAWQWAAMCIYRCGFYFVWLLAEGANNAAGFGFDQKAGDYSGLTDYYGVVWSSD